jgi:hypothetical protein
LATEALVAISFPNDEDDNTDYANGLSQLAEVKSTERSYRLALRAFGRPYRMRLSNLERLKSVRAVKVSYFKLAR